VSNNIIISALLIELQKEFKDVPFKNIFESVFGDGAYEKLASELYDELRAKNK